MDVGWCLQRSPDPLAGLKGVASRQAAEAGEVKRMKGEGRKKLGGGTEEREGKWIGDGVGERTVHISE